jgi:hypothetical protein
MLKGPSRVCSPTIRIPGRPARVWADTCYAMFDHISGIVVRITIFYIFAARVFVRTMCSERITFSIDLNRDDIDIPIKYKVCPRFELELPDPESGVITTYTKKPMSKGISELNCFNDSSSGNFTTDNTIRRAIALG